jgi:hypothetical protein
MDSLSTSVADGPGGFDVFFESADQDLSAIKLVVNPASRLGTITVSIGALGGIAVAIAILATFKESDFPRSFGGVISLVIFLLVLGAVAGILASWPLLVALDLALRAAGIALSRQELQDSCDVISTELQRVVDEQPSA